MNHADHAPVVVIGAGDHGRVVLDILRAAGRRVIGVLDDNRAAHGALRLGVPVVGATDDAPRLASQQGAEFVVGIGDNLIRGRILERLRAWGIPLTCAVHPQAAVAPDVTIEAGVAVMAGAIVNTGARLQFGAVVNTRACVDHDCDLGPLVQVLPGAVLAGGVVVERYTFIGSGAVILPRLRIGENVFVGAGAVVLRDVPANAVVVGVPARILKYREPVTAA